MIKVLIVENNPMIIELYKRYLEQIESFQLTAIVPSVEDAIKVLDTSALDLILLEIYLSEQSGFELLKKIRNFEKSIDVILITEAKDICSIKKAMHYGVLDYLIKPFEFKRFNEALCTYREKIKFMKIQQTVNQETIDSILLTKVSNIKFSDLPKGLSKNTLIVVWSNVLSMKGEGFSTEEMASQIGISRVSLRKYLNFMERIGVLKVSSLYGLVGRPVTKYQQIEGNDYLLKQYI
ncbi:response regulator [Bacillus toyonensis]|uniref:response regulator n=1 Tax=Bacillus toyonensis TaxID=155322 RepID=UPI0018A19B2E|nr:response regulator [Bacillus toyonensis]MBF7150829.1 response regulator [Bacillus toyonensis]MEC2349462.1 response regulator [Bacillus toyonensis]MED3188485.1 response regulator [Bacillus toyonensis]